MASATKVLKSTVKLSTNLVHWLLCIYLWEILLHIKAYSGFSVITIYGGLFSLSAVLLLTLLTGLFSPKANRILTIVLTIVLFFFYASQLIYYQVFGSFYSVSMVKLGGDAVTSFWKETLATIAQSWWLLLIMLVPIALMVLRNKFYSSSYSRCGKRRGIVLLVLVLVIHLGTVICLRIGGTGVYSPYDFYYGANTQTEQSANYFGLLSTMRLELSHLIFGGASQGNSLTPVEVPTTVAATSPAVTNATDPTEPTTTTEMNTLDSLNFTQLNELSTDDTITTLNNYFESIPGTAKNEYTGLFAGYNLIEICAESYSPLLIDKELTPALYKLSTEGIIFNNYYTSFTNTTTNCEYALCTGLLPDLSRNKSDSSFVYSSTNYLPFCLGNALKQKNYSALAFHNYKGSYFSRNTSHPNMGYECYFAGEGMTFTTTWPASDLEMVDQSMEYILAQSEPFVVHYMTFSGHYKYDFTTNPMCQKNADIVKDMPYSDPVKAYIACNMELEYALEALLKQLEENGLLDHTVIVLTGDHYPYGLSDEEYEELAGRPMENAFDKYHNSFICWTSSLEKPIVCDNYCSNIDILPTMLNLFGVDYDSRLLAGTDVLAPEATHVALLTNESFMTELLMFDSSTGDITYFVDEEEVPEGYMDAMIQLIKNKFTISSSILYTDYYRFLFETAGCAVTN